MKKAKKMLEAGSNSSKVARYFGKNSGPNMMMALRRYGYWKPESATLSDLLIGHGSPLCKEAAARIQELEKAQSLSANVERDCLEIEQKLVVQAALYFARSKRYEVALRQIAQDGNNKSASVARAVLSEKGSK